MSGAIGLVLIALFMYPLLSPYLVWNGENVNYWMMIFAGSYTFYVILIVGTLSVVALLGLLFVSKQKIVPVISLIIVANLCACGGSYLPQFLDYRDSFNHVQTVSFRGRIYHLTHILHIAGLDKFVAEQHVVFECDEYSTQCNLVVLIWDAGYQTVEGYSISLVHDTFLNTLFIKTEGGLTPVRLNAES